MSKKYNQFTYSNVNISSDGTLTNNVFETATPNTQEKSFFKFAFSISTAIIISTSMFSPNNAVPINKITSINTVKNVNSKFLNTSNSSIKTIILNDVINQKINEQEENKMSEILAKKAQFAKTLTTVAIMISVVLSLFFIFNGYGFGFVLYTWFAFMMTPVFFKGTELIERKRRGNNGN